MEPLFDCWQDGITVARIPTKKRVAVAGQIESGGRSCMETALETVGIDEGSETLVVVVADRKEQGMSGCTMEEALVRYDATVTLKGDVPNRIRVRHRSEEAGDDRYSLDETVVFEEGTSDRRTKSVPC
ncbi:hypothetical protein [Haladaptatus sp. DYF46]|uniref:hypothetical protein n=1 Tax=Haladaptatus sp. DYF46 TaxID=2886041 RepID=UPI001E557AF1|nr:hypothetical protein [Haladaptatus sp. DYF46]